MFFAMHIMHIFILLINILLRLSQQKNKKGRLFNYKERNDILPENNRGIILIPQILTNNSEAFIRTARGCGNMAMRKLI